jgi:hypothetical protein
VPTKKQELPPRLSEYLLKRAEPFEFYPKRIYGLVPEVRKIFTDLARELVDWRKTFQPRGDDRQLHFFGQPVMLDQFYSKELLAADCRLVNNRRRFGSDFCRRPCGARHRSPMKPFSESRVP